MLARVILHHLPARQVPIQSHTRLRQQAAALNIPLLQVLLSLLRFLQLYRTPVLHSAILLLPVRLPVPVLPAALTALLPDLLLMLLPVISPLPPVQREPTP